MFLHKNADNFEHVQEKLRDETKDTIEVEMDDEGIDDAQIECNFCGCTFLDQ
jgi:hypothetical protein